MLHFCWKWPRLVHWVHLIEIKEETTYIFSVSQLFRGKSSILTGWQSATLVDGYIDHPLIPILYSWRLGSKGYLRIFLGKNFSTILNHQEAQEQGIGRSSKKVSKIQIRYFVKKVSRYRSRSSFQKGSFKIRSFSDPILLLNKKKKLKSDRPRKYFDLLKKNFRKVFLKKITFWTVQIKVLEPYYSIKCKWYWK